MQHCEHCFAFVKSRFAASSAVPFLFHYFYSCKEYGKTFQN